METYNLLLKLQEDEKCFEGNKKNYAAPPEVHSVPVSGSLAGFSESFDQDPGVGIFAVH